MVSNFSLKDVPYSLCVSYSEETDAYSVQCLDEYNALKLPDSDEVTEETVEVIKKKREEILAEYEAMQTQVDGLEYQEGSTIATMRQAKKEFAARVSVITYFVCLGT